MDLLTGAQEVLRRYLVLRGVKSLTVSANGNPIHCYEIEGTGRGPVALLVHGLGGSANGFYRVFSGLAKRFRRVLAPDLPGHGFSPLPDPIPKVRDQLDTLITYWRERCAEPALVVGNSLGGAMSLLLASEVPEAVRGLALVAPAGARWSPERFEEVARAMRVQTTADSRALTRRLFHRAPLAAIVFAAELRKMYGTPIVHSVFDELRGEHVRPEVLGSLTVPTLVLWGGSDGLLPSESVDYFRAHLPPHARVELVSGFGHVPQVERPAEVVKRIVAWADASGL